MPLFRAGRASNQLLIQGGAMEVVIFLRKITTPSPRPAAGRASNHAAPTADGSPSPWHCAIARLLLWNAMETGFHRPMDTPPRHVAGRLFLTGQAGPPISSSWEPVSTALRDSKTLLLRNAVETGFHRPMDGHTSETRGWTSVLTGKPGLQSTPP